MNRFSEDFDGRLARLRDELNAHEAKPVAAAITADASSAMPFWMDPPGTQSVSSARPSTPAATDIADARPTGSSDGESSSECSVAAAAIEGDEAWFTGSQRQQSVERAASPAAATSAGSLRVPFEDLERATWDTDAARRSGKTDGILVHAVEREEMPVIEPMISSGGVTLLPPVEDGLPADSASALDLRPATATRPGELITEVLARLIRPAKNRTAHDAIVSTAGTQAEGDGPGTLTPERGRALPRLHTEIGADFPSSVVPGSSRDPHSDKYDHPGRPVATSVFTERKHPEPVRVAAAPPLFLEAETRVDPAPGATPRTRSFLVSGTRPVSSAGWRCQIPWYIGGLILLMAALRIFGRRTSPS